MVLEIRNFKYDGKGPDVYFYVGKKGTEIKNANINGIRLPYPDVYFYVGKKGTEIKN